MKNKTTTILLAIFLGSFGAHHFYLKQKKKGVLYLIFFWTFIPLIISFIDSIVFMRMSEERFHKKYNSDLYAKAEEMAKMTGMNTLEMIKTINKEIRAEKIRIATYNYNSNKIKRKGVQMLETLYIIGNTTKYDTIIKRFDFIKDLNNEMIIATHKHQYLSDMKVSIEEYKSMYYDRTPTDLELSLLLKPNENELSAYYVKNLHRCFKSHYNEQVKAISKLKREDAKNKRYEKLIDIADDFIEEILKNGNDIDESEKYIKEIENIRVNLYKTRYESQ